MAAQAYDQIAAFIARFQAEPTTRVANIGVQAELIARQYAEFGAHFHLEHDGDEIVEAVGVDFDEELERAWIHGPFTRAPDWDAAAERLWEKALPLIPQGATELEIGYAATNENAARFAERHGFTIVAEGFLMSFPRTRLSELPETDGIGPMKESHHAAVSALRDETFARAWPTSKQLIERLSDRRFVLVATEGDQVTGFLYAEVEPEQREAGIELVGVTQAARGRGVARALVTEALRRLFSWPEIDIIELFVRENNLAARRVYESVGFDRGERMVGVQRPWAGTDSPDGPPTTSA